MALRRPTNGRYWGERANEERIGNDLWGACRCWHNNIIVNFAIAALLKCREVGPSSKRANNGGGSGLFAPPSSSAGGSYIFARQTLRYTERRRTRRDSENEKRMSNHVSFTIYQENLKSLLSRWSKYNYDRRTKKIEILHSWNNSCTR